jgi:hypothetical protein
MIYKEFEQVMSAPRMQRYLTSCNSDSRKTMKLYRLNLRLSQELFTVISCFEVTLRNAIDKIYGSSFGVDWLHDSILPNGIFSGNNCRITASIVQTKLNEITTGYAHQKLLTKMDFGFWRYLFAQPQFSAGGHYLLKAFPAKPRSSPSIQYNHTFVFSQLKSINDIRNRIAHHEPICFLNGQPQRSTTYARQHYGYILQLFQWMQIDESALLYGIDHVNSLCNQIDRL